jgi:hypothetical protein
MEKEASRSLFIAKRGVACFDKKCIILSLVNQSSFNYDEMPKFWQTSAELIYGFVQVFYLLHKQQVIVEPNFSTQVAGGASSGDVLGVWQMPWLSLTPLQMPSAPCVT